MSRRAMNAELENDMNPEPKEEFAGLVTVVAIDESGDGWSIQIDYGDTPMDVCRPHHDAEVLANKARELRPPDVPHFTHFILLDDHLGPVEESLIEAREPSARSDVGTHWHSFFGDVDLDETVG